MNLLVCKKDAWQFDHDMNLLHTERPIAITSLEGADAEAEGRRLFGDSFLKAIPVTDDVMKDPQFIRLLNRHTLWDRMVVTK